MTTNEYMAHVTGSFPKECFNGQDGFVFNKSSLEDGLRLIEGYTIGMEEVLECSPDRTADRKGTLTHYLRKSQAIANILIRCLDGVQIHTNSK